MNSHAPSPINNPSSPHDHLPMLKESITVFLAQYRGGVTDFSDIGNLLLRFLPRMTDTPLEIAWFYSAMRFHTARLSAQEPSRRFLATKDLFQLLCSSCSSYNNLKKIAALAPVVQDLCHLALERQELKNEVEHFLEIGVFSYIGMCCSAEPKKGDGKESLSSSFADLVRLWTVDGSGGEELRVFFPMVSDEARKGIGVECEVGYIAGLVMVEAFLLRLCLKFGHGSSREDMHNWAVSTITDFRSFYFVDILLRMLSEPVLPITFLLSSEDEVHLRNFLYDAVVRVEYSFLIPQNGAQPLPKHLKYLTLSWLFVGNKAMLSIRENIDKMKLASFMGAFEASCLTSHLINWVLNQPGMEGKMSMLADSPQTPTTIINWIRTFEHQGVTLFDKEDFKHPCHSLFRYSVEERREEENLDDAEMVDSVDNALLAVPGTINLTTPYETRKRKEGRKVEGETQPKFAKCDLRETLGRQKIMPWGHDDALSSGSEVDNPVSEEDAEDMEQ